MNERPLLAVDRVAASYGRKKVLTDVSFCLYPGEMVAVVGENGSGKTTLLKVITGLLTPDRGRVEVRGTIGYCPQEPHVFGNLTVAENFRFFATAYGIPAASDAERELLERLKLAAYADTVVDKLSGGTRQKLNLSLALIHDPQILILDEPYAGFDWETYLHFWEIAVELRAAGRGLLIVSHLVYGRERLDRIFELSGGRLRCA